MCTLGRYEVVNFNGIALTAPKLDRRAKKLSGSFDRHGAGARRSVRLDSLAAVLHRGVPNRRSQRNHSLCRLCSVSILLLGVR